ncbi:MAG: aspartate aminotransferase family protein [Chloroflexi bacterium]|nr:aspartate aminotransferase family protein [Chloroflexota bacterium]
MVATLETTRPELEQDAIDHLWFHGWDMDWEELTGQEGLKVFARAKDCTLIDVRGREFIDGLSGLMVVNVGHGRREIGEAMAEQAGQIAYAASSNYTTIPAVKLARTLAEITPGDLERVFFCSGGSEAVETALKIAKQAQALRGYPKRYKIITRRGSYHGMTLGALSLTAGRQEEYFGPFMYGVSYVPSPNRYKNDFGLDGEDGDIMCARYVEQEIINQGPETVAAVIGEPVSVSNGTHVPSPRYWQMLREICDRHGVFLIMDEIINGFGRTGTLFAAEQFGVVPDIMTIAKGLSSGYAPIAAAVVRPGVFEGFKEEGASIGHLLTFGGHAVATAAANANIAILLREGLVERSAEQGAYLLAQLQQLRAHPTVGDVRGVGLLCAVELVKSQRTKENWGVRHPFTKSLGEAVHGRGLLTRVWNAMHFAPPLVVTREEIDRMVAIADEALTEVEAQFAGEIAEAG